MRKEHMHFKRTLSISTLLLCFLQLSVSTAQTVKLKLSQSDAISIALQNNRDLNIARLEMEKADSKVSEAYGTALPNFSVTGQYTRAIKKPVFFLPDFQNPNSGRIVPIEIGSDNSFQFGFQATQILFNSAVFTGVGTAKIFQKASLELYKNAYNKTIANVKRAFNGALLAEQVFELMLASQKNADDNLHVVQLMANQGIVSEYDLIRAQVGADNIRPTVLEAERNTVVARNSLKILLGLDATQEIEISGQLVTEAVDQEYVTNADTRVVEANATLKALDYQSRVNEEIVSIYHSESLPTLFAFGNYQWQAQNNELGRLSTNDFVRSSQVGLSLDINLFNGFQTSARVNQAEVDYLQSKELYLNTKTALRTQVQNITLRLTEASRRIAAQSKTVEQAEKGYQIATTRYSSGSGTQLEVNDADLALMRARVNKVQAIFDYNTAAADLEEILSLNSPH